MKLLVITQKVDSNDSILGFFHSWLNEFAQKIDRLTVICLSLGEYSLPKNVKVLSLGKEENSVSYEINGLSKILNYLAYKFKYILRFYKYIWSERKNYDAVFVHMNPIYVILGAPVFFILRKKIVLWYVHKNVDWKLRLAMLFVNNVCSASKESFRLENKKVKIVGHGIDINLFAPDENKQRIIGSPFKIISIGRVSKTKGQHIMIEVLNTIVNDPLLAGSKNTQLILVGGPVTDQDGQYFKSLHDLVSKYSLQQNVKFIGPKNQKDSLVYLKQADFFVNISETGSMDKAILEAMSCEIPIITSNVAFKDVLKNLKVAQAGFIDGCENLSEKDRENKLVNELIIKINQQIAFTEKYNKPFDGTKRPLRQYVLDNHQLPLLIDKLIEILK